MTETRIVAEGLEFPEGPVALSDGSLVVVEIQGGRITRIGPDGSKEVVAEPGGGPNGAALGPDGKLYVTNNGGSFSWVPMGPLTTPGPFAEEAYSNGRIERVDLDTGEVEVLYTECDERPLRSPNDLVFDSHGGFYFTDYGIRSGRTSDLTGVLYAKPDGSEIREVIFPLESPNGVGLSPNGDRIYVAETYSARVWWWEVTGPGQVEAVPGILPHGGSLLTGLGGFQGFDSLAVDSDGNVCVATLVSGGISVISPNGSSVELVEFGDPFITNICFGGDDLRTAYVTLSGSGKLAATEWPRPGLALAYSA